MRTLHGPAELHAFLAECAEAGAASDAAMRAAFLTAQLAPPADLPADPFSPDYAARQLALYRELAGRDYTLANEAPPFDPAAMLDRPFPYNTQHPPTVGDHLMLLGFVLRGLRAAPGARLVEFGAGWGNLALPLARMGYRVTAVELDPGFCALLRARAAREDVPLDVVQADFLWAEGVTEPFDAAIFCESFHHCAEPFRLLRALRGAVRPEGQVLLGAEPIVPDFPMPWGLRLDGQSLWAICRHGWLELGFREDFFLLAAREAGWDAEVARMPGQPHISTFGLRRLERETRFPPARLHAPQGFVLRGAGPGWVLHGPYSALPAGRWRARLLLADGPREGSATLDACTDRGTRVLARGPLKFAAPVLDFTLPAATASLEIRLHAETPLTCTVEGVEIEPLPW